MDAFFASVEQLDNPALRGKPVIVGGAPGGRGVVAACSYEARAYGIHSAMPSSRAHALCRHAIFVRPRKERYQEISRQTMALLAQYTDLVEPVSVDEAFLDITVNTLHNPSATRVAQIIREEVLRTTGLTASAGVSYNKFLAKLASDQQKPNGLTVIPPEQARDFLRSLPIRRFFGVGKVTEKKMLNLGIRTGMDLERFSRKQLAASFGSSGSSFYDLVRGIDYRPVQPQRLRKSIGTETTLQSDIINLEEVLTIVERLSSQVGNSLKQKNSGGRTLTLKVRYEDFTTISRSCSRREGFFSHRDIWQHVPQLLAATEAGVRKIRLLGLTVSNLYSDEHPRPVKWKQLPLPYTTDGTASPLAQITTMRKERSHVDFSR